MQNGLRKIRRERDESQEALAQAVGVSRQTIIDIEKGHTKRPSDELMTAIADHYGVPIGNIFFTLLVGHILQNRNAVLQKQISP